ISTTQKRSLSVSTALGFERLNLRALLFLCVICFLLFWSFWGKDLERRFYGAPSGFQLLDGLGADIVFSPGGGHEPMVMVDQVRPNSQAAFAGLKPGDQIIGVNGQLVSSPEMIRHMMSIRDGNNVLKLTITRNGQSRDIYLRFNETVMETQALKNIALKYQSLSTIKQVFVIAVFLKIVAVLFFLLYKDILNRTALVLLFAAIILFVGNFFRVYTPMDAFFAIKFNTISLLLGMGIISVILDASGFFDRVAVRVSHYAGKSHVRLLIGFCLMTYFFSLLVNNLTTILIIVPMTLKISEILRIDPRPIIIGEVISSNLGGASTMVGDFPNILISSEAGIGFSEFIIYMMPICLILLGILLIYLKLKIGDLPVSKPKVVTAKEIRGPQITRRERWAVRRAVFVLFHVVFLFIISDRISLNPSAVALFGGLSLFLFSGLDRREVLSRIGSNDILFFMGLFVVVGGLEASGLLPYLSLGLAGLSFGKPWALCLVLMWSAALMTAFLNAGPTAALFFPVVMGFNMALPHHVVWWSLSLGVLAGSSATILGATAGPVAGTLLERFGSRTIQGLSGGNVISFGQFARIGVPVMFLFLSVSSVYIVYLCYHL
ncbi:MAG: SLC13 family permease, partial [Pseudomonadota bacterium]